LNLYQFLLERKKTFDNQRIQFRRGSKRAYDIYRAYIDKQFVYVIQKSALLFLKKYRTRANGSAYEPYCYYFYFYCTSDFNYKFNTSLFPEILFSHWLNCYEKGKSILKNSTIDKLPNHRTKIDIIFLFRFTFTERCRHTRTTLKFSFFVNF